MTSELADVAARSGFAVAEQQPSWCGHPGYRTACETLASAPSLVTARELAEVGRALAEVARGRAQLLQIGDCAESFAEVAPARVRAKLALLHALADRLASATGQRVVRVGRLGGQFAKPRSQPVEQVGDQILPVFRGHMVNSAEPTARAREHDPRRMIRAYFASARVLRTLRRAQDGPRAWASHDALVLDYETNLVRTEAGVRLLGSTHLPWLGERTRQPDSAHVRLLATVANPVACKIGPGIDLADLRELCARLDPDRTPGRLTLIARLGAGAVTELFPRLVAAVRSWGHPVVWLSDPMHGNTIRFAGGLKTRRLADVIAEAVAVKRILCQHGLVPGGLHLEVATDPVTECLGGPVTSVDQLTGSYTTLCDPRLNPAQAALLIEAWLRG